MKVTIGPYRSWVGPYQIAEMLCWWTKPVEDELGMKSKPDWVHDFGTWLSEDRHGNDSWLLKVCQWIESKKKRKIKVKIHRYDTWSMDHTLAPIILPMLRQLRETKHGAPLVDDEDVPEHLRSTSAPPKENDWDVDANHFLRWDWVLDEMIQAFECHIDDQWEEQYSTGKHDLHSEPCEWDSEGKPTLYHLVEGPLHTRQTDWPALQRHQARNQNGFRLFGKYYQNLWD